MTNPNDNLEVAIIAAGATKGPRITPEDIEALRRPLAADITGRPVTNSHPPACYGIGGCPHHSDCRRYQAVEDVDPNDTVSTCSDGKGGWPWYVRIGKVLQPAALDDPVYAAVVESYGGVTHGG